LTTVVLYNTRLENDGLAILFYRPFYNTSITKLVLLFRSIRGQRGGDIIRSLLFGNNNILELKLYSNPIGPEGAAGIGRGLFYTGNTTTRLQKLDLSSCEIGNAGLANLMLPTAGDGGMINNNTLTKLILVENGIEGAEGGRQVTLLLQRFPKLKGAWSLGQQSRSSGCPRVGTGPDGCSKPFGEAVPAPLWTRKRRRGESCSRWTGK
jgi:Leucine Rich repeat